MGQVFGGVGITNGGRVQECMHACVTSSRHLHQPRQSSSSKVCVSQHACDKQLEGCVDKWDRFTHPTMPIFRLLLNLQQWCVNGCAGPTNTDCTQPAQHRLHTTCPAVAAPWAPPSSWAPSGRLPRTTLNY